MACYSVTKLGFLNIEDLLDDILNEMTGQSSGNTTEYFESKFDGVPASGAGTGSQRVVVLASTAAVDPLANVAKVGLNTTLGEPGWRICFNKINDNKMAIHVATDLQLTNTGEIAQLNDRSLGGSPQKKEPAGNVGEPWTGAGGQPAASGSAGFNEIWLNRTPNINSEAAYPMSYLLTLTNRGVFLAVWEDSQEEVPQGTWDTAANPNPDGTYGNSPLRWLLVQRSVDRLTGHVRGGAALRYDYLSKINPAITFAAAADPEAETSRCPVYCISGSGAPQKFLKFVVREADIVSPSRKRYASVQQEDQGPLLNPYPQQSLTESGEFVVTFINNLSTSRFKYSDELDMLGTVGADVVGAGTEILVNVYNEPKKRQYTALYATERYGTGMRLMVLTKVGYDPADSDADNLADNIDIENSHNTGS
jgi:hypothetical protein